MRRVAPGVWKKYRVTVKKVHSGELKDYLVQGMEFEYNGVKLRMNNLEYHAPNITGFIRRGWIEEIDELEVNGDGSTLSGGRPKSLVERSMEAKAKSTRILPEGWSGLHWTKKCKFIEKCTQQGVLDNIIRSESRAVKEAAEKRQTELSQPPPQEVVGVAIKRGPQGVVDVEAAEELAQAVGAEQTPTGEEMTAGDEG